MLRPPALAVALLLVAVSPSVATVLSVAPDGTGDYPTIQAAIDAAVDGDVVELGDGVFQGYRNHALEFLGKAITLRSASGNAEACVIDGEDSFRGILFLDNEGRDSIVESITIRRAFTLIGGAAILCLDNASPTIRDCWLEANRSDVYGAGVAEDGGSPLIQRCVIVANEALYGSGIFSVGAIEIEDTVIVGNIARLSGGSGGFGAGMECHSSGARLTRCTISGNRADVRGGGVWGALGASGCMLEDSILWGNCAPESRDAFVHSGSIQFLCCDVDSSGVGGAGTAQYIGDNLFVPPLFCDPAPCGDAPTIVGDYRLAENSPCLADPVCGLIGALGQGCGVISVDLMTWGRTKAMFRE